MNFTPNELEALQELVLGAIDSLDTDGEDDPETTSYQFWKTLSTKLATSVEDRK